MQRRDQKLADILDSLSPLAVEWMDEIAASAIARLTALTPKNEYDRTDIEQLLQGNFEEGLLCARLFLALSKDGMETELRERLGPGGIGVNRYKSDQDKYLSVLESLGLPEAMAAAINYEPIWSDILVERLRSGRGSAITGQRRGRGLEEFAEAMIKDVFQHQYEVRCTFVGADGRTAKCDFAIPTRHEPRIVVEVKGYGATGSKMTDIIGDLDAIIDAKRHDTSLLFVTDGTTWKARISDLRKVVVRQNQGKIARIYTTQMREEFRKDLQTLKSINGL